MAAAGENITQGIIACIRRVSAVENNNNEFGSESAPTKSSYGNVIMFSPLIS